MNKKTDNALILFVKAPRAGTVKTRLQPELTAEQSLLIYRAMVEDIVCRFHPGKAWDLKIYFTPAEALEKMTAWLGNTLDYFPQTGSDLGEKMHNALAACLQCGYQRAVLIGSDIPLLDTGTISQAFSLLTGCDVVIGPAADGGYYLIGLKQPIDAIFRGIHWSSQHTLAQTIQTANSKNFTLMQLDKKKDIDTFADLKLLWGQMNESSLNTARLSELKTYRVLKMVFRPEPMSANT